MKFSLAILNYFYIGLVILWDPIQRGVLNFDGAGRSIILLTFLVILLNLSFDKSLLKRHCLSTPILFWILWVIYSAGNLLYEGYYGELSFFFFFMHQLVKPLVVMILTIKETLRDNVGIVKFLTFIFVAYALLSITLLGNPSDSNEDRLLGELGNLGPLNALYIVFFASLLFVHKKIGLIALFVLIVISFLVTIPAGTRKAFAAAVIIMAFLVLSQFRLSFGRIMAGLIVLALLWNGIDYALETTALGERFEKGAEEGLERNTTGIKALDFLGDRATFYINGWAVFKDNLINGIGLKNYFYKGYGHLVLHSEYLVQLVEGGIIGSLLYLIFNYWILKGLFRMCINRNSRDIGMILSGGYLATLFIGLTAWTYQFPFYFAVLGTIIGHIKILYGSRRFVLNLEKFKNKNSKLPFFS